MKIPAEFAPKSWELPPDSQVLEASARVVTREWGGEKLDWLVALAEVSQQEHPIVWLRPLDSKFDAGFVAFDTTLYKLKTIARNLSRTAFQYELATVWQNKNWGRYLCLNKDGMLRCEGEERHDSILFALDGNGKWELNRTSPQLGIFKWNEALDESEFCRLSCYKLWRRLQAELSEPESEICFAREFALMEEQERYRLVFGESSCSMDEFKALLRAVALRESLEEIPVGATLLVDSSRQFGNHFYWDDGGVDELSIGSAEFHRDVALLRDRCFPVNQEIAQRLCVRKWLEFYGPACSISVPYPTAHEQLEAHLRWRDWLASKQETNA